MSKLAALVEHNFYHAMRWCMRNQRAALLVLLMAVALPVGTLTWVEYRAMTQFAEDSDRAMEEQLQHTVSRFVLQIHDRSREMTFFLFHLQDREHTELLKNRPEISQKLIDATQKELDCEKSKYKKCTQSYTFIMQRQPNQRWQLVLPSNIEIPITVKETMERSQNYFQQLPPEEKDVGQIIYYDPSSELILLLHPISSQDIIEPNKEISPPRSIEAVMGVTESKDAFSNEFLDSLLRRQRLNRFDSNPVENVLAKSKYNYQVKDEKGRILMTDTPDWETRIKSGKYLSASILLKPEQKFLTGWEFSVITQSPTRQIVAFSRIQMITLSLMVAVLLGILLFVMLKAGLVVMRVSEMRSDIVAGVSHDLKTPLAGIIASAQLLDSGRVSSREETKQFAGYIVTEAQRLTGVVEKVLTLAKLESSQLKMKPTSIPVPDLVDHAIKSISCAFPEAMILKGGIPQGEIYGDFQALTTVLVNLMDNAIRYSHNRAWVKVQAFWSQSGEHRTLHVQVEDKGMGIPADEQPFIFQKFYRVRQGLLAETEGTGLGLAIASQIIKAHNGYIQVESEVGVGSKFIVRLPCERVSG